MAASQKTKIIIIFVTQFSTHIEYLWHVSFKKCLLFLSSICIKIGHTLLIPFGSSGSCIISLKPATSLLQFYSYACTRRDTCPADTVKVVVVKLLYECDTTCPQEVAGSNILSALHFSNVNKQLFVPVTQNF